MNIIRLHSAHLGLVAAILAAAPLVHAQTAITQEFGINTTTAGDQQLPVVARAPDGHSIVVWDSEDQDGSLSGIVAQRLDAYGNKIGDEIIVPSDVAERQSNPAVAVDAQGNFVVAWNSATFEAARTGVFARRFAADGTPRGAQFRVNNTGRDIYALMAVAMDSLGNFAVAWPERQSTGLPIATNVSYSYVMVQRYRADGTPNGAPIEAARGTLTNLRVPGLGMDDTGAMVAVWNSDVQSGYVSEESSLGLGLGIYGQRIGANGSLVGGRFQINTTSFSRIFDRPVVAVAPNGSFAVAWQTNRASDLAPQGVEVRRYDVNGVAQGRPFTPDAEHLLRKPALAMSNDRLVVAAHAEGLYFRAYDVAGNALGDTVRADAHGAVSSILQPAIALSGSDRRVMAIWQSRNQDGDGRGIRGRSYLLP